MKHSGTGPENIAARSSGTVTDLFNQFMEEKADFDRLNARERFSGGSYGHYSQIVWASNTKLGCGLEDCSAKGFVYKLFLVCRYQTGNILGYEVYGLSNDTYAEKTGSIEDTKLYSEPSDSSSGKRSVSAVNLWLLSSLFSFWLLNDILNL